ncbi:MAG TPA: YceD family protein [Nevskia sp.]|jgi:uncharacterized protein|nr:YceD family protein [Nevskia sp.]
MKDGIPQRVKASTSVTRGSAWSGAIPIARLPRLAASLTGLDGELQAELHASCDLAGAATLKGRISGALGLVCQTCMKPFSWPLQTQLELRLVSSEAEEKRLLHDCEPLLVEDDSLHLHALVEEEALLALPIAPRCAACAGE